MLKLNENGVTTAASRVEILEYITQNHSALYVEEEKGERLNCCPLSADEGEIPPEDGENIRLRSDAPQKLLKKPLLLDMQTANVMLAVRKLLTSETAIHNFDTLSWARIGDVCWKSVK